MKFYTGSSDASETANSAGISKQTAVSRVRGRPFREGQSGNPRGRPKRDHDVAALARSHAAAAIAILANLMADNSTPPGTRVMAANALLDRGFGRPPQSLDLHHALKPFEEFEAFIRTLGPGGVESHSV